MLVHPRVSPGIKFACIHFFRDGARHCEGSGQARARFRGERTRLQAQQARNLKPPINSVKISVNYLRPEHWIVVNSIWRNIYNDARREMQSFDNTGLVARTNVHESNRYDS